MKAAQVDSLGSRKMQGIFSYEEETLLSFSIQFKYDDESSTLENDNFTVVIGSK